MGVLIIGIIVYWGLSLGSLFMETILRSILDLATISFTPNRSQFETCLRYMADCQNYGPLLGP